MTRAAAFACALALGTGLLAGPTPSSAAVSACARLQVAAGPVVDGSTVLAVTPPPALAGTTLTGDSVSVGSGGQPLEVLAVQRVSAGLLDVAVVIDSSAATSAEVWRAAQDAALGLIDGLPPGARVAVVSSGGEPAVLVGPTDDMAAARGAVAGMRSAPGHAPFDALLVAEDVLPDAPTRYQDVVVIAGGPDDSSTAQPSKVQAALVAGGVGLQGIELGERAALPVQADGCPGRVGPAEAAAAGGQVAARISGQYRVVVPAAPTSGPLDVRVRTADADLSARFDPSAALLVEGVKPARPDTDGAGLGTLGLSIALGLVALFALLTVMWLLSPSGREAKGGPRSRLRAAIRAARADGSRGDAEAQAQARVRQDRMREDAAAAAAAARARRERQQRAAERREAAIRSAELQSAEHRAEIDRAALREAAERAAREREAAESVDGTGTAQRATLSEREAVHVAAVRAAADAAAARRLIDDRVAAERAAAEAAHRAEQERVAAAAADAETARLERVAAEQAAI
ncbi:MAG: vWA domain-containing protein, partial [Actinomycetes bacterium]